MSMMMMMVGEEVALNWNTRQFWIFVVVNEQSAVSNLFATIEILK